MTSTPSPLLKISESFKYANTFHFTNLPAGHDVSYFTKMTLLGVICTKGFKCPLVQVAQLASKLVKMSQNPVCMQHLKLRLKVSTEKRSPSADEFENNLLVSNYTYISLHSEARTLK